MLWWLWSAAAGLPLGALAAVALASPPVPTTWLRVGALAGAAVVAAAALGLRRNRDDHPARAAHLARASAMGWVAAPALLAQWLGMGPGAVWTASISAVLLALALERGSRARGPCAAWRYAVAPLGAVALGALGWTGLGLLLALAGDEAGEPDAALAAAVYDLDAAVETRPLPGCRQALADLEVLEERGAHPRLAGDVLWFDAPGDQGRRQVYRRRLSEARSRCWSCGQPGHNARPAPDPTGALVVFDSDRDAAPFEAGGTDLYQMVARGDDPPRHARRLTFAPGGDDHAVIGPSPDVLVWSRSGEGRSGVVMAGVSRGHGGVRLRTPRWIRAGGAGWAAPLGWSRDARTLLVSRGSPFRALAAEALDPATGEGLRLLDDVPAGSAAGFNADGGWVMVATGQRAHAAGALPGWLGFAAAPLAAGVQRERVLFRDTGLATGPSTGPLAPVAIGEIADWGAPTGVAASSAGDFAVLGQRRLLDGRIQERLLRLDLVCVEAPPETEVAEGP